MAKKQIARKPTTKAPQSKTKKASAEAKRKTPTAVETKPPQAKKTPPRVYEPAIPETKEAFTPAAARTSDSRLPAPGTRLQKLDRHGTVRCECTVETGGVRYAGKMYRSLSSAAMAAAKDLGLNNKTQNGFIFWGIVKASRQSKDVFAAVERAWERYHGSMKAFVEGTTDENRSTVIATVRKHAQAIESIRAKVA